MEDFLDYIKDLEQGDTGGVSIDELAPESDGKTESGITYDPAKDPEYMVEAQADQARRLQEQRLKEAKRGERIAQWSRTLENPSNATFEDFMESGFSQSNDSEKGFNSDVAYLRKNNMFGSDGKAFGLEGGTAYDAKGESRRKTDRVASNRKEVRGPYDDEIESGDEEFSGDPAWDDMATSLSAKYGEASPKADAESIFRNVARTVRDIILKATDKRHAIIFGDPGVGKCMAANSKIRISVDDDIFAELEDYLKNLK
jgi:hypothetical protein